MNIGIEMDAELQQRAEQRAADAGYASVSVWISDVVKRELQEPALDPVDKALEEILGPLDHAKAGKLENVRSEMKRLLEGLREDNIHGPRDHVMAAYKESLRRYDSVYRRLAQ